MNDGANRNTFQTRKAKPGINLVHESVHLRTAHYSFHNARGMVETTCHHSWFCPGYYPDQRLRICFCSCQVGSLIVVDGRSALVKDTVHLKGMHAFLPAVMDTL